MIKGEGRSTQEVGDLSMIACLYQGHRRQCIAGAQ